MTDFAYTPILRWKQGEQGALRYVGAVDREHMLPIAEIQGLERGAPQPILERQLLRSAGKTFPIGIDLATAYDGPVPIAGLVDVVRRMQLAGIPAWPVLRAFHAMVDMAALPHLKGQPAVVIRAYGESTPLVDLQSVVAGVRKACGKRMPIYVVLDLYALGDIDVHAKAALLQPQVAALVASGDVAQIGMAGGSFPMSLGSLKQGVGNRLPRRELAIWKILRTLPNSGAVMFGDYGVTNPEPLEDIDPSKMNPAAAIRYALKGEWWVLRGAGVRTKGKGGMGQYNDLCRLLIRSADYSAQAFSYGDGRYYAHAQPGASSGNLTTWRRDATSHHVVFTIRQLLAGNV